MLRALFLVAFMPYALACAATLEKLSLDEMSQKSTLIVKGRVLSCGGETRGSVIYTRCQVAVQERWKGQAAEQTSFIIPGGTSRGLTQTFTGIPRFDAGLDYVLFLWAGRSGVNQVIGLSQGVFDVKIEGKAAIAKREASSETMLNAHGDTVSDTSLSISLAELRKRVQAVVGGAQ